MPELKRADALLATIAGPARSREVRTFMFTDIVGSTALVEAIGDEAWGDLLRWHDETLSGCFERHAGEEVHRTGDGFFVAFADAGSALACAAEIQRSLADHRRDHGFAPGVRIGLHSAEATRTRGDYEGAGVHAAARIAALANGGEVLASQETVDGIEGVVAEEPREVTLKGLAEPVRVAAIDWTRVRQRFAGAKPSTSRIEPSRWDARTAVTRSPIVGSPSTSTSRCRNAVSAPSSLIRPYVTGVSRGWSSTSRRTTVHDSSSPDGPHSMSGVSSARQRSQNTRAGR